MAITQILLFDHSRLNSFLHSIQVIQSPTCVIKDVESIAHFLFDCPIHNESRIVFKTCISKTQCMA